MRFLSRVCASSVASRLLLRSTFAGTCSLESSSSSMVICRVRAHREIHQLTKTSDAAKHYFEDCMQSPLPHLVPLKVCAMLALANILNKSFLAFVYIGEISIQSLSEEKEQEVLTDRNRPRTLSGAKSRRPSSINTTKPATARFHGGQTCPRNTVVFTKLCPGVQSVRRWWRQQ